VLGLPPAARISIGASAVGVAHSLEGLEHEVISSHPETWSRAAVWTMQGRRPAARLDFRMSDHLHHLPETAPE
jgi:hypothetical protein